MLVQFASMTIDIRPKYRYTYELCRGYEAPAGATPDFFVQVTDEEIQRDETPDGNHPVAYLESLAIYRRICSHALNYGAFLFHGSALCVDGQAYLFTAPSGTGKSTHARLWREMLGDRVFMVNDDKPLIHVTEQGIYVCGTPWDGKHQLSTNCEVPLRAICILSRGEENHIVPITPREAYATLLSQTYRPKNPLELSQTLTLLDKTMANTALYHLHCNMDPSAASVAYEAMK